MKKIIKLIGLFILIVFSFFYTDKVASVIYEKDDLMIKIKKVEDLYRVEPIDGIIDNNTIIPGLNGKKININKSYKKLREFGIFDKEKLVYDSLKPNCSISNNKDKFIIRGNSSKQMVSIIFILDDDKYFNMIESVANEKEVIINYFVTSDYLINNSTIIASLENREVYNYGNSGKYTPDNIIFSNNLISRITKNDAIYCLSTYSNKSTLELCSSNGLYTVLPNIIIDDNAYSVIKDKVSSGSIILIKASNSNIKELSIVIDYIRGKGLIIGRLSSLLSENLDY